MFIYSHVGVMQPLERTFPKNIIIKMSMCEFAKLNDLPNNPDDIQSSHNRLDYTLSAFHKTLTGPAIIRAQA